MPNDKSKAKIIVNGKEFVHIGKTITYFEVVKYENPNADSKVVYTISYTNGPKANPEGIMTQTTVLEVKTHMEFNADATTRS